MIALVMPPQKKQRARTSGKGAAKKVRSPKAAARAPKAKSAKDAVKKQSHRPQPRPAGGSKDSSAKESVLRVALPGDLYEQAGQWWWRTQLPGESNAKARPLNAPGARDGACDREAAERTAVEMWGQAAAQHGARQITLDCTQKVERLKAQFLDKVRQLTEIVESANAKAQAEAKAREEIEARLSAMIQAAERQPPTPVVQTQAPAPAVQALERTTPADVSPKPVGLVANAPSGGGPGTSGDAEGPASSPGDATQKACTACPAPILAAIQNHSPQTGICECCGAAEVPVSELEAIDSGQLLCPDCIAALHIDISRIETTAYSDSRA